MSRNVLQIFFKANSNYRVAHTQAVDIARAIC
jgi:hypothetical protein